MKKTILIIAASLVLGFTAPAQLAPDNTGQPIVPASQEPVKIRMVHKEEVYLYRDSVITPEQASAVLAAVNAALPPVDATNIEEMNVHVQFYRQGTNLVAKVSTRYVPSGLVPLQIR